MRKINKAVVLSLVCLTAALPQEPKPDTFVLRSDVNVIVLHATVQDRDGGFVSGLDQSAFKISEDGVPQQITIFSSEDVPVAVGLVMDNSGSMTRRRADVITGALTFIKERKPDDEIFVVNFNNTAELALPDDRPFSADAVELRTALMKGEVGGQTALYDGIALALNHLDKAKLRKKVLLIVSDGGDNRSKKKLEDVVKMADRAGVLMYTIGLFDEHSEDRNPGVLRRLARQTGGLAYMPKDLKEVSSICSQIARDIRNQYTVGYSSSKASADTAFHQVKLTAVDTSGRQLQVRSRTGFYGVK
jgi:Ca-activated chloride channel homolog